MSKQVRNIKEMSDDEFVNFFKKAAKNMKQAEKTMEKDFQKGMQDIINFWENR